jgi:hypothetical protein
MDNYQTYGQQSFDLPHDMVQLPTGGIFYKSKKKSVKVGYLTAADENIILGSLNNAVKDGVVLSLLRNKLFEPDLRPEDMLTGDIEAILIFLRNTSFGHEYNVTLTDPVTKEKFNYTIHLDELNIKKCENKPNEQGYFEVTLPKSGLKAKLKPLNMSDTMELERMANEYPTGRVAPKVSWRLNKQIISLNDNEDRGFIAQTIENLPIGDSKFIRNFLNDNEPSLDLKKVAIAPSGEKVEFDITFGVEFFRPFF